MNPPAPSKWLKGTALLPLLLLVAFFPLPIRCDGVVALGTFDFDEYLAAHPMMLVEFYAPWCGHCKKLEPEYEEAAATLDGATPAVVLAKVDATASKPLAKTYGVRGFPTLKWFPDGSRKPPQDYTGPRTAAAIVAWVKKMSGPPPPLLTKLAELQKFVSGSAPVLVGFFGDANDDARHALELAASSESLSGLAVGFAAPQLAREYDAVAPAIVLITNGAVQDAAPVAVYGGDVTNVDLQLWVRAQMLPLIIPFSQKAMSTIFGNGAKVHVIVFADDPDGPEVAAARAVAKATLGRLVFVHVGAGSNDDEQRVFDFFAMTRRDAPAAWIVNSTGEVMVKHKLRGAVTESNLADFVARFEAGTLPPHYHSSPLPTADSTTPGVVEVVGRSFDDIVLDPTKDVLVMFYAPWCAHSKKLHPTWVEFAEVMEKFSIDDVVVARMDATVNEHSLAHVKFFPTIRFFPASPPPRSGAAEDAFVEFEGKRHLRAFAKFVQDHGKAAGNNAFDAVYGGTEEQGR